MEVEGEKNVEKNVEEKTEEKTEVKTEVKTDEKVEEGDEKVVSEKKKRGRKRKEDSTGTPNPAKKPKCSQVKNNHSGALKNRKLILKNVQIFCIMNVKQFPTPKIVPKNFWRNLQIF